ncbi:MAG: acyl-CoA thioesterase II, partial [Pseudomonadota bacterium]
LDLDRLEIDLFRGVSPDNQISVRVFGGQVIAQALVAAYKTVDLNERTCHSLHGYFMRPGDPSIPIIYEVDRARDGGSFATRRVVAIQHGKQIFNLAASFHRQEDSWSHQHDMPDVPAPETLKSRTQRLQENKDKIPAPLQNQMLRAQAVEVREVDPLAFVDPGPASDRHHQWFRMSSPVDAEPWIHHCLLAYASDMALLGTGNRPHGINWWSGKLMSASLDHAIWFHGPIKFDEWHLYTMDSPFSGGARSFNRGAIYSQDGRLVASVAQEGLMRPLKPK